jgi:hypothetical protein
MRRTIQTFLGIIAITICSASPARAASPGPLRGHNGIEDALADGDIDQEDFVSWRMARPLALVGNRSSAYVALSASWGQGNGGGERGAMLVVQLPIDRIFAPTRASFPAAIADQVAPAAATPPPAPARPALVISASDARACVKAALRASGMGDDTRLESIAARARASAAFPELRLRALRTVDQSGRLTYTELDPYRYSEAGATGYTLEARLTFRLDRVLFADEEVPVERMRIDRQEARTRIAAKALAALFEWQRAYAMEKRPDTSTEEHLDAVLREAEAAAALDVMTDGWFSGWRASADAPAPAAK